jgi:hypothetical protein
MPDYWQDGHIDCKDYAVYNTLRAKQVGASNIQWKLTKEGKHVFIIFEVDGIKYVADNDKLYRVGSTHSQR